MQEIPTHELVDLDQVVFEEGDVQEVLVETSPASYTGGSNNSRRDISFPSQSPTLRLIGIQCNFCSMTQS